MTAETPLLSVVDWLKLHARVSFVDVVLAFVGYFIYSCVVEKLTNRKGPMVWPVFGILPSVPLSQDGLLDWATSALIKAGGTFPFRGMLFGGTHGVMTADVVNIEYMLRTRFDNFPKGKYYRDRFTDLLGQGIFNADNEAWREQRRLATSEMHSTLFMQHAYRSVHELVHHKLLKLLEVHADMEGSVGNPRPLDLQDVLLRFTFENICVAAFGVDPGCLAVGMPEVPFARAFEDATELTLFRFLVPPYVWKTMRFFSLGHEKRLRKAVGVVHEFADKTVSDRRTELSKLGNLADRADLLSKLMDNKTHDFSDKFLRDFCVSFILAGRDTSSVALAWFFWLVQKHPLVQTNIMSEIEAIILNRRGSTGTKTALEPEEIVFTLNELSQMVYLHAALTESLRLYPPVPIVFKQAEDDDILPDGTVLKRGAGVMYSIYSMARVEALWGKDCEEFRPERWVDGEGKLVRESQYKYAVFNAGPRLCIGKKFAYMQMKMVAASVLWRYTVEVVEDCKVVPKLTTTLYMKNGLPVLIRRRAPPVSHRDSCLE